jgi:NTE family protein
MQNLHKHNTDSLEKILTRYLGDFDAKLLHSIEEELEWITLRGGEVLFNQDDESDALYIVISGRLTAWKVNEGKRTTKLGNIWRGETVGELAMFTNEPRSATVIAARDSTLVKLKMADFHNLLAQISGFSLNITRLIISRFSDNKQKNENHAPVNICLLPTANLIDWLAWSNNLAAELMKYGSVKRVTSTLVDAHFNSPGIAQATTQNLENFKAVADWLDELEATHQFLIYIADSANTEWTKRCKRQADKVVLVAEATQNPNLTPIEQDELNADRVDCSLVLLHTPDTILPKATSVWLQNRPWVKEHYHLRQNQKQDLARLGRILSGNAIGLVLAGGGAKGFAHVGVYLALREFNIPIDYVGGTSIGATVAAAIAAQRPDEIKKFMKKAALYNPTKDLNWYPIISLMKGKRVHDMVENAILDFCGRRDVNIEDFWLTHFAVSSNYTQAKEMVHTRGLLKKNLLASIAIPGVFPPVVDGNDLLIDGGTFNNFPVDVMKGLGVKKIIGCDLVAEKKFELKFTKVPTTWQILRDRLKPKQNRKYRMPSLTSMLLNTTILYSTSKREEAKKHVDILFNPNVSRYGMTNWKAYDKLVDAGYTHAKEVLSALPAEQLKSLQDAR